MIDREAPVPYETENPETTADEEYENLHPIIKVGVEIFDKIERTASAYLGTVNQNRIGECFQCGQCCKLLIICKFLEYDEQGKSRCKIYNKKYKPKNCSVYPQTKWEQKHPKTCGYNFKQPPNKRTP